MMHLLIAAIMVLMIKADPAWGEPNKKAPERQEDTILNDLKDIKDPFLSALPVKIVEKPVEVKPPVPEPKLINVPEPPAVKKPDPKPVITEPRPKQPKPVEPAKIAEPKLPTVVFKLNGVLWNTETPSAILNDKIVTIGDEVADYKVISISKDGVELIRTGIKTLIKIDDQSNAPSKASPVLRR